ncbi:hypothetical protein ACWY2R_07765 [Enterococcus avium]
MKTKRRRIVNTIIVCALLLSQLIPVAAIAATSEESTSIPVSEIDSTSSTEAPLQSSSTFPEQQETKPEINENEVEKNYDERALEENPTNSEHPTVTIEEKKIVDDQLKLKGKIKTLKSATKQSIIKKLVLQSKSPDGIWVDKKEFEINSEDALQKNEIDFQFDEFTNNEESFRLITEYELQFFESEQLTKINRHRAHFDIADIENVVKGIVSTDESNEITNESTQTENSTKEVDEMVPVEKYDESTNASDKTNEEKVGNDKTNKTNNSLEQNNAIDEKYSQIPKIETSENNTNVYSRSLIDQKRSLGRVYQEKVPYDGYKTGTYGYSLGIRYFNIKGRSADVSFLNGNQKQTSGASDSPAISGKIRFVYSDNPDFINAKLSYGAFPGSGVSRGKNTYMTKENFNTISSSNKAELVSIPSSNTAGDPDYIPSGGTVHKKTLTNLLPNKTYYGWFLVEYENYYATISLSNLEISGWASNDVNYTANSSGFRYSFETKEAVNLSGISTPEFDNSSVTSTVAKMKAGSYLGDISQNANNGVVQVKKNDDTTFTDMITNLGHSYIEGTASRKGTYSSTNITGLTAGTKYNAKVGLQKYQEKGFVYSSKAGNFSTKNDPKIPSEPTKNTPTADNPNATAEFTANYGASKGTNGDHPANDKISIEVSNASKTPLKTLTSNDTSGSGIRLSAAPTVTSNVENPYIKFKLEGLSSRTTYNVRYKVTNTAGESIYSDYKPFTTNAIELNVYELSVTNQKAISETAASAVVKGKYTGDPSQTKNADGLFQTSLPLTPNSWSNGTPKLSFTKITGTTTTPGTYGGANGTVINNLKPGTKYNGQSVLYDFNENQKTSSKVSFSTPIFAKKPENATGVTHNEANIKAYYGATSGTTNGDHPNYFSDWDVQIRSKNGTGWSGWSNTLKREDSSDPSSLTGIRLRNVDIKRAGDSNSTSPYIVFTIVGLSSKTDYEVRYSLRNSVGFSDYSESSGFTTKGVPLEIKKPTFNQESATPNSIKMNQGFYTGDISTRNGHVYVQASTESGWTPRADVLEHENITGTESNPGKYGTNSGGYTVTNLKPGAKYFGWVSFKNYENTSEKTLRADYRFYTPNKITELEKTGSTIGNTIYSGEATFKAPYEADDITPKDIKVLVSSDEGTTWTEATENAGSSIPKLEDKSLGGLSNKEITFKLSQLKANTNYSVRLQSKNTEEANGQINIWSNTVEATAFTTQNLPNGYYLDNVPNFDFGTIDASDQEISAGLSRNNGTSNFNMDVLNVGMPAWTLSAKMSEMETNAEEGPVRVLNGARIEFTKKLEKTSDSINWTPVTSGFSGLEGAPNNRVSLTAGSGSIDLFKADEGNDLESQGTFRNVIDFESVKLIVPPNVGDHGKTYKGEITWTLDSLI